MSYLAESLSLSDEDEDDVDEDLLLSDLSDLSDLSLSEPLSSELYTSDACWGDG